MQDKQPWIVTKQTTEEGKLTNEAQGVLVDNFYMHFINNKPCHIY
jgi:hypothetical protein